MKAPSAGAVAQTALYALLPAAAAGGGLALAPLLGLAGFASVRPRTLLSDLSRPPLWLLALGLFAAWMALSWFWSPFEHALQALKFVFTVGGGLMFARAAAFCPRIALAAAAAATLVLAMLLAIEAIWDMPLNRAANPGVEHTWQLSGNPGRGAAVLAVLIWAGAGWLWTLKRRALATTALIGAGVLTSQFGQTANLAAFGAGALAFALALALPRFAIAAAGLALAAWLLLAPFATLLLLSFADEDALPYSWAARIEIWRYVSAAILEQPWIGHGLDASRVDDGVVIVHGQSVSAIPLHPHSASLQIWFETGAVGAGLAALGLCAGALALARALHTRPAAAAAATATLAAIGVIANVSFGVWQEWWNATAFIAAAFVTALVSFYAPPR